MYKPIYLSLRENFEFFSQCMTTTDYVNLSWDCYKYLHYKVFSVLGTFVAVEMKLKQ